ncbi:MAG TPA: prenyltransferase/squalene oxidase repeat-containing protein [Pirellulales bacterium]|nr:prenyltransferase/squalene oxidase repeat-containing protein [Pirellulales bacterium]
MATDSSPGSKIDLPSAEPAPKARPAAGVPPKKPATNGKGLNTDTGDKPAAKTSTTAGANKAAAKPAAKSPAADTKSPGLKKAAAPSKPAGKVPAAGDKVPAAGDKVPAAKQAAGKAKVAGKAPRDAKTASSTREELEELERVGTLKMITLVPAWMISAIVHMVILLIFGLMLMPEKKKETLQALVAKVSESSDSVEEVADISQPESLDTDVNDLATTVDVVTTSEIVPTEVADTPAPTEVAISPVGIPTAPAGDLLKDLSVGSGGTGKGALAGRGGTADSKRASGATDASEAAVARALKWLAEHQLPDGSWSFDHTVGKCQGQCTHPGTKADARFAATGLALLPFLGAGHTHKQGKFKDNVRLGLYWLASNMKVTANGGAMVDSGAMYGHGIASIALCEAYAMTQDKQLAPPAQASLNFIMYAQDPVGGGWRYQPREAGDTSVAGWQIMALKSGYLGFLEVDKRKCIPGAMKFLDSVQADGGTFYGYNKPGNGPATTAIGLLCRMYMGWPHEKPELEKGVKYLAGIGPQTGNMYFSYYATQVLHQYDGPDGDIWTGWNTKMRDSLVASQAMAKHETGSWMFTGADHGFEQGGRLYCTALATMTLEIYYRYMPIYTQKSSEDDFE